MSPTKLSEKHLRDNAMLVARVEHYDYHAKVTKDLFGFADTIALNPITWNDVLLVQSTSATNHSHRVEKILANDKLPIILRHCRVEVWSWGMKGPHGQPKKMTLRRTGFALRGHGCTVSTFESDDPFYL